MYHPTLFGKRAEKQGSLNWLTPHSTLLSLIMNYYCTIALSNVYNWLVDTLACIPIALGLRIVCTVQCFDLW